MSDEAFELITQEEAAKLARCTVRFLQKARARGDGPPIVRLGTRNIRHVRGEFIAWLRAKTAPAAIAEGATADTSTGAAP